MATLIGGEFTQNHTSRATHIVTKTKTATRTLKFFMGILTGAWIVSMDCSPSFFCFLFFVLGADCSSL